jgi:hypothetical protein
MLRESSYSGDYNVDNLGKGKVGIDSSSEDISGSLAQSLETGDALRVLSGNRGVIARSIDLDDSFRLMVEEVRDQAVRVEREVGDRALNYSVIDGDKLRKLLPTTFLPMQEAIKAEAELFYGEKLVPLDGQADININLVGEGDQQSDHLDRNPVTYILYLTKTKGGELEYTLPNGASAHIDPHPGVLVSLIGADEIRHRVKAVEQGERIAIVFGFGRANKTYTDEARDDFLYTDAPIPDQVQRVFDEYED